MFLTANAAMLLRVIKETEGLPETAGLRISSSATQNGHGPELELSIADGPLPGDRVDSRDGEVVFVAPDLAADLASAALDVAGDEVDGFSFVIRTE